MLPVAPPSRILGVFCAALVVGLTTALVFPLRTVAPVVSLGVVYLVAVLLISTVWGAWLGVLTAIASALAFNYFHIPPTGRFTIADSENWVALVVFLIVAVIGSSVAQVARARATEADQRRREADLAAEMARLLLRGNVLAESLPAAAQRLATALNLPSAAIELAPVEGDEQHVAFPLREGTTQLGTLLVPAGLAEDDAAPPAGAGRAAASRRCSRPGSTATACSARWWRRARCAAPTSSRRRCCARSPTTCARR